MNKHELAVARRATLSVDAEAVDTLMTELSLVYRRMSPFTEGKAPIAFRRALAHHNLPGGWHGKDYPAASMQMQYPRTAAHDSALDQLQAHVTAEAFKRACY